MKTWSIGAQVVVDPSHKKIITMRRNRYAALYLKPRNAIIIYVSKLSIFSTADGTPHEPQ